MVQLDIFTIEFEWHGRSKRLVIDPEHDIDHLFMSVQAAAR